MLVFLTCVACDVACSELNNTICVGVNIDQPVYSYVTTYVLITAVVTAECLSECLSGKTSIRSDFNRFVKLLNNDAWIGQNYEIKIYLHVCLLHLFGS